MLVSRLPGMANLFCSVLYFVLAFTLGGTFPSPSHPIQPPIASSQVTDSIELHDSVAIVQDEPSVHQRFVSRTTAFELKNQQMRAPKDDQFECCPFTVR
ncbi:hypothetical protein T08_14765 [Trichinella sp. T8]|nr:hypothetical protein T08_14765 [Trichinella sp. T8]